MKYDILLLGALVALPVAGCADRLGGDDEDAGRPDGGAWNGGDLPQTSGAFTHAVEGEIVTTLVDATSASTWHHLDLDTGYSVAVTEGWELGFSRFRVRINGGLTGNAGVQVAALTGQAFEDVTRAPEEGWTVPVADGEIDDDSEPDNVFNNGETDWYEYEVDTHTLTPRDVTYVVASGEGRFFKLAFEAYYDAAGSPAFVRFRWAQVEPPMSALPDAGAGPSDGGGLDPDAGVEPLPPHAITVAAGDGASWVYVSASTGVVTPASPETDASWDVAFRRTEVRTNGGTSGSGLGGAQLDVRTIPFDEVTSGTTLGYTEDVIVDSERPGAEPTSLSAVLSQWYDYDPSTHTVAPGDRTYLVRRGDGGYAKLRIWRWNDGEYALSLVPITRDVEVRALEVTAPREAWTYVSLRSGVLVTVTEPATDAAWDLAFSGERIQTNSGTSGGGEGGAVETTGAIADLGAVPTESWAIDESLIDPSPGGVAYSGNPTLAGWYDYNPSTHVLTPRAVTYVIRTADGHGAALRLLTYEAGVYGLEVAYAGPGQTEF